jgi:hypothetical protein
MIDATMSDAERIAALDAEQEQAREMATFIENTTVEYLARRLAAPLPHDDAEALERDLDNARRKAQAYIEAADAKRREADAIREAEHERLRSEARELARALIVDASKVDRALKTAARYERALIELRQRLAIEYAESVGVPSRYIEQRSSSHDQALAAAGVLSDLAQSRGPVTPLSYVDQVTPVLGKLLADEGREE